VDNDDPYVVGLPDEFDLTPEEALALNIDVIVAGCSLTHGLFETSDALGAKAREAYESGDVARANALQLLVSVTGMMLSDERRAPFGHVASGIDGNKRPWHTALPEHLGDRHVAALQVMLAVVKATSIRARIADVLWHRLPKRNPVHGREAVAAYLSLADTMFDPDHWTISEQYFSRAYRVASNLGPSNSEIHAVIAKGWEFLDRLDGNDRLFYTERIIRRIFDHLTTEQIEPLLVRVTAIIEGAGDFDRIRTYYDVSIRLAHKLERHDEVRTLRIARAETHISQALMSVNETHRTIFLRNGRQELLNAGASPARVAEVSAMLDQSQTLAVGELQRFSTTFNTTEMTTYIRGILHDLSPMQGLWTLAAADIMTTRAATRQIAEENVGQFHFAYGFGKRVITHDGREQAQIPGSLGSGPEGREAAIIGAMRDIAAHGRMVAVYGAIEPGRQYLLNSHVYTIAEIYHALRGRPFIPHEHHLIWSKGIHAGLVGEYDVAVHILAPQLENALRDLLRRRGVIVYATKNNFQRLLSIEDVLDHEEFKKTFPDDYVFTLDSILADRLGANVRNDVAHGLMDDGRSNSHEAAYLWWFALRLLLAVGPNPLDDAPRREQAGGSDRTSERGNGESAPPESPTDSHSAGEDAAQ
jgi:hypothetical protein